MDRDPALLYKTQKIGEYKYLGAYRSNRQEAICQMDGSLKGWVPPKYTAKSNFHGLKQKILGTLNGLTRKLPKTSEVPPGIATCMLKSITDGNFTNG